MTVVKIKNFKRLGGGEPSEPWAQFDVELSDSVTIRDVMMFDGDIIVLTGVAAAADLQEKIVIAAIAEAARSA